MNHELKNIIEIEKLIKEKTVIFFDMDETLISTNYANYLSYKSAINDIIGYIPIETNNRFTRKRLKEIIPNISNKQYNAIIKRKNLLYKDYISETKIIQPIVDILNRYTTTHKTILVTNSRKERALQTLEYHNLTNKFDQFIFKDSNTDNSSYKNNKYLKAISNINISSNKFIIAFDNEEIEIKNAQKAGIKKTININYLYREQVYN